MKSSSMQFWGKLCKLLLPALICSSFVAAHALPTPQEIESAIRESKDVPKEKKFSAAARDTEVMISTYIEPDSKDPEKDCKIDAVLLARLVMTKFSEINRVAVSFYGFKGGKTYKQATVTRPEIIAFGSGQVDGGDLLAAIRLEDKIDEHVAAAEKKKTDEKEGRKEVSSEASKEAYKKAMSKGENPEAKWITYRAYGKQNFPGLTFQYPEVWRVSRELEKDIIVSIKGAQTCVNEPKIELKLYQNPKRLDVFKEAQKHAQGHQKYRSFKILKPSAVTKIGAGGVISAVGEHYSYTRDDKETSYEHHYYFGWPGYVYKIMSAATKVDSAHMDNVFKHVLSTIRMEAAPK